MIELLGQSAAVAVLATLISESVLFEKFRDKVDHYIVSCPICLSFWFALPTFYYGFTHYFLVLAMASAWMLIILKLYNELEKGT